MEERDLAPWEVTARRELLDARPWMRAWAEDVRLPDGRVIEGFLTLEMPDYVNVVALTAENRAVVTRQYKHGARRVAINLPAGYVEPGEDPLAAARRELLEETGYVAERWLRLGSFASDGNRGSGTGHYYLARGSERVAEPDADDLEDQLIELMPFAQLARAAVSGDVVVLTAAAAIGLAAIALTSTEEQRGIP